MKNQKNICDLKINELNKNIDLKDLEIVVYDGQWKDL